MRTQEGNQERNTRRNMSRVSLLLLALVLAGRRRRLLLLLLGALLVTGGRRGRADDALRTRARLQVVEEELARCARLAVVLRATNKGIG